MTDTTDYVNNGAEFLRHYGAKGMKWGVRKDRGNVGKIAKTSKINRLDRKFERQINDKKAIQKIGAEAARNHAKTDMKRINRKRMYKGKKLQRDELLRNRYHHEQTQAMLKHLDKVAASKGTNASGTRKLAILEAGDRGKWILYTTKAGKADVKHAAEDDPPPEDLDEKIMSFKLTYDEDGFIIAIDPEEDTMEQYTMAGEDFLEHFGKKGMKWGVRKDYKSWKKESTSAAAGQKVIDAAIKSFQPDLKKINNDPMFKGKDLTKDKKLNRQYQELAAARFNDHLVTHSINQSATTMHGGRAVVWQMGVGPGGTRFRPVIMKPVAKHAAVEPDLSNLPSFDVVLDDKGFIVDIKLAMEHSSIASGEDFLEHYGRKGMKWGVRKQTTKDGRAGNRPPLNPHQKAALEATKGAKRGKDKTVYKKGPKQLTDEQLKARINRMQLEKQYKDLNAEPVGKGKKLVEDILSNAGKQVATTVLVGAGLLAVNQILGKKFDKETAAAITGKGKKKSGAESVVEEVLKSKRKPGAF